MEDYGVIEKEDMSDWFHPAVGVPNPESRARSPELRARTAHEHAGVFRIPDAAYSIHATSNSE